MPSSRTVVSPSAFAPATRARTASIWSRTESGAESQPSRLAILAINPGLRGTTASVAIPQPDVPALAFSAVSRPVGHGEVAG